MQVNQPLFRFYAIYLSLLLIVISNSAIAGVFSVSPVRMYLAPEERAIAVTITNESDQALVMEADIYEWSQTANGEDKLVLTEDLFLSPPIIKLAPKKRQVVRLAVLNRHHGNAQKTYRMIVRELPEARPTKNPELEIALAFSMPVFITPKAAKSNVICTATANNLGVLASCQNNGNAYTNLRTLTLLNASGKAIGSIENGGYILPNVTRDYQLKKTVDSQQDFAKSLRIDLDNGDSKNFNVAPQR